MQPFQLVDDPLAGGTDFLSRTPELGEAFGLFGLALGLSDGEGAQSNGTAGPLINCVEWGEKDEWSWEG